MRFGPTKQRRGMAGLVLAIVVMLSSVLPAAADENSQNGQNGTGRNGAAKIEPALAQAIAANPGGRFRVIVTRETVSDENQRGQQEGEVDRAIADEGGQTRDRLKLVDGHAATLPGKGVAKLARNPQVSSVSADHRVYFSQLAPPAPVPAPAPVALLSGGPLGVNAPAVWSTYGNQGQGVTVAVIDSGIAASADLPTAAFGVNTVAPDLTLADGGGHGTHVAGVVAGTGALSAGAYQGVAPKARVVMVKVISDDGKASYSSVIKGIQWVVANKAALNIRVANLSFGAAPTAGYINDPLVAAVEMLWFRGVVVVASAGNSGPNPGTVTVPGTDPYAVTVGAYDDNATPAVPTDDVVPFWSSRGPTAFDGIAKPDVAAPGRKIISLRVPGSYLDTLLPDRRVANSYFRLSGTSMAAPAVAGVAALIAAQNPSLTPNQIKYVLTHTARPLSGYGPESVGAGAVDALAAVRMAVAGVPDQANRRLVPNSRFAKTIYPLAKGGPLIWRDRLYKNVNWDGVNWNNITWDNVTWENLSWENISWETVSWSSITWEALVWSNITWESVSWEAATWETTAAPPIPAP